MLSIIFSLAILGLILWLVTRIPMDPAIAQIIRVVAIVAVVLWLLSLLLGHGTPLIPLR